MSQTIRDRPRCAGRSSNRIDLVPSVRAAVAWCGWLLLISAVVTLAVDLAWPARIGISLAVMLAGGVAVRTAILLIGPWSVRVLEWQAQALWIRVGPARLPLAASVAAGSFRLGRQFLLLTLDTSAGRLRVLIDAGAQDPAAFRALCRWLRGRIG
jgi:hypothetical protein